MLLDLRREAEAAGGGSYQDCYEYDYQGTEPYDGRGGGDAV